MPRYLIHEHSKYSNPIDNYWIYLDRSEAITNYKEFIENAIAGRYLDYEWYQKLYEQGNICIVEHEDELVECISWIHESLRSVDPKNPFTILHLNEGDYVVLTSIN
jgi:hypothetical protein